MNLYKWSTTAASNNSAVPDGAPEGWLGQNVNDWARESMARIREQASDAAYIDEVYNLGTPSAKTITRGSDTQLTIANCDATSHFTTGRRIRVVGATTDHGYVTSSSYGAPNTTVNVTMDSGALPAATITQVLVHVDAKIRSGAYYATGSGNSLDADKVDGYHAADIFGPSIFAEAIVNGSMAVAQRGAAVACPVTTNTYTADHWFCNPAAGSVTWFQTLTALTGAVSKYGSKLLGAASASSTVDFSQRIESYLIPYIKTTVTISALVKNETGASLVISLRLGTPGAADDFTTVTNRLAQSLTSIGSGSTARVTHTVDISGYTNIDNGLEVCFRMPAGSLNSAAKSVTITEVQIDRASTFSYFRFRPFQDEYARCLRYYQKTFAYDVAPEQNWEGAGSGIPAGCLIMSGSSYTPSGGNPNCGVSWLLPQPMRATPTVTTYNPRAAAATAVQADGSGNVTLTVAASTTVVNFSGDCSGLGGGGQPLVFGAQAVAEL